MYNEIGDVMKKEKFTYETEEQKELTKFFIVLAILIVIILGVYFFSKAFVGPKVEDYPYQTGSVSTTAISVGTLLNAPEKEYYVLAYDTKSTQKQSLSTYTNYYTNTAENPIKIYYLDLANQINKPYYVTEKSNPKATKIQDLKMLNGTLLLIEGQNKIKEELKVTD